MNLIHYNFDIRRISTLWRTIKEYNHRYSISKVRNLEAYIIEWLLNGNKWKFPLNYNKETTQEYTYIKENITETNHSIELPGGIYFLLK